MIPGKHKLCFDFFLFNCFMKTFNLCVIIWISFLLYGYIILFRKHQIYVVNHDQNIAFGHSDITQLLLLKYP